jgi:hypothetical protein
VSEQSNEAPEPAAPAFSPDKDLIVPEIREGEEPGVEYRSEG